MSAQPSQVCTWYLDYYRDSNCTGSVYSINTYADDTCHYGPDENLCGGVGWPDPDRMGGCVELGGGFYGKPRMGVPCH